jgi:hypothetical protein
MPHLWAVAATLPLAGRFGWGVELSGERAPHASGATAHALGFVTASFGPSLVLDAGWTVSARGPAERTGFVGVTYNAGRLR